MNPFFDPKVAELLAGKPSDPKRSADMFLNEMGEEEFEELEQDEDMGHVPTGNVLDFIWLHVYESVEQSLK